MLVVVVLDILLASWCNLAQYFVLVATTTAQPLNPYSPIPIVPHPIPRPPPLKIYGKHKNSVPVPGILYP